MADAVLSFAIQKLGEFLSQKIDFQQNVRTNVDWLRNELGYMRSFVKDAEEKQENDHLVKQWISEITNLSYDAVSILEDFTLKIEDIGGAHKLGFLDRLHKCACICSKEVDKYNIGMKIKSIKERVLDISRKRVTYGIRSVGDTSEGPSSGPNRRSMIKASRGATSHVEEEKIFVGFDDVIEKLLNEVLKADPRRSTVSVLGMGGLGKTTVARKLYNSSAVFNEFPYRAWVGVSQEYSIVDLFRTIIKSFKEEISIEELKKLEKMNEEDLKREIRKTLKDQRYLVVVDDVWSKEAWHSLKGAFPDCKNGSRVIITTRKRDVATRADDKCFVHELRFLTPDESWDLFCMTLSCDDDFANWCSVGMRDSGRAMVQKCRGLPLAVIVLGGLLAHKRSLQEWQMVKAHLWRHMKDDSVDISPLLSLSYNDLSSELKQCFLYLGMFPEDYLINAEKLMWFWMAEGFIQGQKGLEDIAEDYLNALIDRCLIQVAGRFWGKTFSCRIHDLLRDLAVEKAKEVCFFDIHDPHVYSTPYSSRRCAIHNHIENFLSQGHSNQMLRSLLFFNPEHEILGNRGLTSICKNFEHLCLLDLENMRFGKNEVAPAECIGNLIHLRYLGLTNSNVFVLPKSIGNLKNLQTLEAMFSDFVHCHLPTELSKLVNLRHIFCRIEGYLNLGTLSNLRSLRYVNYDYWTKCDTANLINLRKLSIENIGPPSTKVYSLDTVGKLKNLSDLFLQCEYGRCFPSLEPLSQCQCLLKLWLDGKIEKVLSLEHLPQSITDLTLSYSLLKEDPMPILEKMVNLRSLDMTRSFNGNEIVCGAKGFPQLEYLHLCGLDNLEKWKVQNESLLVIRSLGIYECPKLKVPERLQSVSVLRKLEDKYNYGTRKPRLSCWS